MQNEQMQSHAAKFKVTGGNASPKGTGSITLTLSPEATSYAIELPDKTALELDEIESLDRVVLKRGWSDWKEWLKAGAVAGTSIFGGGLITALIIESIDEVQVAAEALTALQNAMDAGADSETVARLMTSLAEADLALAARGFGTEEAFAALAGLASIGGSGAYGAVVLSRRKISMEITLKNSRYLNVELPEYMGAFLQGAYRANSLILNAREAAAATNGEAANDHGDEGATAADDTQTAPAPAPAPA